MFSSYSKLLFATLFFIALSFGFFLLGNSFAGLLYGYAEDTAIDLVSLTFSILSLLLCIPLFFGYTSFCIQICKGKDLPLSEIFFYYSTKASALSAYAFFLKTVPALLLKVVLPLVGVPAFYRFLAGIFEFYLEDSDYLDILLLALNGLYFLPALGIIILCFFLFGSNIVKFICMCAGDDGPIAVIYRKSAFFLLRLSMIPVYILSILTFGVLFIVYTLPFTVIVYSLFLNLGVREEPPSLDDTAVYDVPSGINDIQTYRENNGDTAVFDIDKHENN